MTLDELVRSVGKDAYYDKLVIEIDGKKFPVTHAEVDEDFGVITLNPEEE